MDKLNELDQNLLDSITEKAPAKLTKDEVGILLARRAYLRPEQLQVFGEVMGLTVKGGVEEKKKK